MPYKDKEKEKKRCRFKRWKSQGLVGDYEIIHDRFINTTHCDLCNVVLVEGNKGSNKKCMDHDHTTGEFRYIVCNTCNSNMLDQSIRTTNKSGLKNIHKHSQYDYWVYQKSHYGKTKTRSFKNKIDAVCYKYIHTLQLRVLRRALN